MLLSRKRRLLKVWLWTINGGHYKQQPARLIIIKADIKGTQITLPRRHTVLSPKRRDKRHSVNLLHSVLHKNTESRQALTIGIPMSFQTSKTASFEFPVSRFDPLLRTFVAENLSAHPANNIRNTGVRSDMNIVRMVTGFKSEHHSKYFKPIYLSPWKYRYWRTVPAMVFAHDDTKLDATMQTKSRFLILHPSGFRVVAVLLELLKVLELIQFLPQRVFLSTKAYIHRYFRAR